jgi:DNA-binding response OmpR family regulator
MTHVQLFDESPLIQAILGASLMAAGFSVASCSMEEQDDLLLASMGEQLAVEDLDSPSTTGLEIVRATRNTSRFVPSLLSGALASAI